MSAWKRLHDLVIVTCAVAFVLSVVSHYAGWEPSEGVLLTLGAVMALGMTRDA
jgi:hypothetical protein